MTSYWLYPARSACETTLYYQIVWLPANGPKKMHHTSHIFIHHIQNFMICFEQYPANIIISDAIEDDISSCVELGKDKR